MLTNLHWVNGPWPGRFALAARRRGDDWLEEEIAGLVGACLLIWKGVSAGAAIDSVSGARGLPIPETEEQRRWIERYAAALAGAK